MNDFRGLSRLNLPSHATGPGGSLGVGPSGAEVPPPAASLQVFPWWYYPLPSSQYIYVDTFNAAGTPQTIAAGAQAVLLAGSQMQVNVGERAVIVAIAVMIQSSLATDNYFFTMLRNGGPVEGLRQLRNFAIAANGAVREFGGYAVKLSDGDSVSWTVTNNGAAPIVVSLSYQGWRASADEISRFQQGVNY